MVRVRSRLRAAPVAVLVALLAAQALVLAMLPREGVIDPLPVDAADWFTAAELDRAREFREPQRLLFAVTLLTEAGLLAVLVLAPGRLGRLLRRRWRRPVLAAGAAGGAISLLLALAALPPEALMRQRSLDVGLATRSWPGWAWDVARSAGIGALLAGLATMAGIGLMRRLPRTWWLPAAGLVAVGGVVLVFAGPLVLAPLFNRFDELPPGRTRADVVELARRAGVEVGDVFVVDASKRTTAANAYVTGLGSSKRIVLYDTLLRERDPQRTRLVVAHELAHVHHRDVPRGLLFLLLVAPPAMFAVSRLVAAWAPRADRPPGPATVPALYAAVVLMTFLLTLVSNQLSRGVEARADSYALGLTGEARAFIAQQRSLARQNVSDPDPPGVVHALLGTHPTPVQRIGIAEAYLKARPPDGAARPRPPGGS